MTHDLFQEPYDRRELLGRTGKALVVGASVAALGPNAIARAAGLAGGDSGLTVGDVRSASGTLNVIGTATYHTPVSYPPGVKVKWGFVGTNEQSIQKTAQKGAFDVVVLPNGNVDPLYYLDRLEPIDTRLLDNWEQITPRFRNSTAIRRDGKVAVVPHHWGYTYTVYDPRRTSAPRQLADIMSPKLTKRIAMFDDPYVAYATMALLLGHKGGDHLTVKEFNDTTNWLKKLKPQLLQIIQYGQETQIMSRGDVDVLFGASANSLDLIVGAGVPAKKVFFGSFSWWMAYGLLKGAKNPAAAYKFMNYGLTVPVMKAVTKKSGTLPVVDGAASAVAPAFRFKRLSDVLQFAPVLAGPPVKPKKGIVSYQQMIDTWQEVKA